MKDEISAVLVHNQAEPLAALERALKSKSIRTTRARTCQTVSRLLTRANPPHLVFTDTTLPDGSWADVLTLAARAPAPVNVIVVARVVDVRFYVETIERGAFDFVAPPFAGSNLDYVVRSAVDNVLGRRDVQARAERSGQGILGWPLLHTH